MAIIPKASRCPMGVQFSFTGDKTGAERFSLVMHSDDAVEFAREILEAAAPTAPAPPSPRRPVAGWEDEQIVRLKDALVANSMGERAAAQSSDILDGDPTWAAKTVQLAEVLAGGGDAQRDDTHRLAHRRGSGYAPRMADTSPLLALARRDPAAARAQILEALTEVNGNRTHAAERLGVHRSLLARCAELCGALPEMARLWPGSDRGGGIQSEEHREKSRESVAGARKAYRKRLVSPQI